MALLGNVPYALAFCLLTVSEHAFPELLDTVPQDIRRNMWFMHDGAPAHFSHTSRNYLDTADTRRWIGRQGLLSWLSDSIHLNLHLNPLNLLIERCIKNFVCASAEVTAEELQLLYLVPQHSWHFSAHPSVPEPSGPNLSGSAMPTFLACPVTLTTVVTSCHGSLILHLIQVLQ
jgi:hypothetical protein